MRRIAIPFLCLGALAACRGPGLTDPPGGNSELPPPPSVDVGTLGLWTKPTGLSDEGRVIGWSGPSEFGLLPITWRAGEIRRLEMFPGVPDDQQAGWADAINQAGQIAGIRGTGGLWYLTRWDTSGGAAETTPLHGASEARAVAINRPGDVLVRYQAGVYEFRSAVWRGGTLHDLGQLSTLGRTEAFGLNDAGTVVGRAGFGYQPPEEPSDPDAPGDTLEAHVVRHPFVWDIATGMQDLGVFGKSTDCRRSAPCASGAALAINSRGDVVGWAEDSAGVRRPFLWRDGELRDLGVFPGQDAVARAINDRGQIAGDGPGGAFVWEAGVTTPLGSLGGGYVEVTAMNERGDVAGTALTAAGEQHAVVWRDGVLVDLGVGLPGAQAARAVAINGRGDVLAAAVMECFRNVPEDARLCNFTYVRPQRAVLFAAPALRSN